MGQPLRPLLERARAGEVPKPSSERSQALVRASGCRRCGRRSGWCWCGTGRARGTRRDASQGSSDISVLTPKGESQAETSRLMLLSDSFDACFTSPLARSRRIAEIIWAGRDEDLIPDSDLREIDLYSFQGLLKHEGKERYGVLYRQWQKNAANFSIDGHYPVRELWDWDYANARLRAVADKVGAMLLCDMAHISGLIAAQVYGRVLKNSSCSYKPSPQPK